MNMCLPSIITERLALVKPSPSMAAKAMADALVLQGRKIFDFTVGEPDFDTPTHILDAGIEALREGQTRYGPPLGVMALRSAIAQKLSRENALTYSPQQIAVGSGAKHILAVALAASLNSGDEVIIPAPYWVSYPDMVLLAGGVPCILACPAEQGFKLTARQLETAITPRTRWLILNTPSNPTGAVYTEQELAAIAAVLERHPQVWLMSDEIYEHFIYGSAKHISPLAVLSQLQNRALLVNGLSKAYAMTGWRIGYAAGPQILIQAMALLLSQSTTCTVTATQYAAIAALNGDQTCVAEARTLFAQRGQHMARLLSSIEGINCQAPDGAFYVFADVRGLIGRSTPSGEVLSNDQQLCQYLLQQAGVATVSGSSYGLEGYLRLSFATSSEVIDSGCAALATAAAQLQL